MAAEPEQSEPEVEQDQEQAQDEDMQSEEREPSVQAPRRVGFQVFLDRSHSSSEQPSVDA